MSPQDIYDYRVNYDRAAWERITQGWRLHVVPPGAILAINALCDEVERLREDAERYRWLRTNGEPDAGMNYRPDWTLEMYDAAIDAARKATP